MALRHIQIDMTEEAYKQLLKMQQKLGEVNIENLIRNSLRVMEYFLVTVPDCGSKLQVVDPEGNASDVDLIEQLDES